MTDRTLTVLGAGLAGLVWIGLLTAVLWEPEPGEMGAALLLGLTEERPEPPDDPDEPPDDPDRQSVGALPYPFTNFRIRE